MWSRTSFQAAEDFSWYSPLPLALQCWSHSSASGSLTSPADQWLITPGLQDRPDTKFPHCHPAYVKLLCLPSRSHDIWQPALISGVGKPSLGSSESKCCEQSNMGMFPEGRAGRQPLSAGPGRRSRVSWWLLGIWGFLCVGTEMKQTSNCDFKAGTHSSHGAFIAKVLHLKAFRIC